jgi:phospholipid/cholesterol/gamma-HCH transport system permease protein
MAELNTGRGWSASGDAAGVTISLEGDWTGPEAVVEPGIATRLVDHDGLKTVAFDAARLGRWDSALLVFLLELRRASLRRHAALDEGGLPESARQLLSLVPQAMPAAPATLPRSGLLASVGQVAVDAWTQCVAATTLLGAVLLRGGASLRGATLMRRTDLLAFMQTAGLGALPVIALVNVLVGAILSFMGAVQLRKFGADIYVADLVGIAVVREMAPLMTAIVMCGRTGGAYAAELATMNGSEETGALVVLGVPTSEYLVLPRVAALTLMMPLLYLYAAALGILGGAVVAVLTADVPAVAFLDQLRAGVTSSEVLFGFVKCITFGLFIGLCGCRIGLAAGRSSADVGSAATRATVTGIVGVIAIDSVFALCAHALDF